MSEKAKVNPNNDEMEQAASVSASELNDQGMPETKVLNLKDVQKHKYKWMDIFKDDPDRKCAVKVLIGDPFLIRQALSKEDVVYSIEQERATKGMSDEELQERLDSLSPEEILENDEYTLRLMEATICTFIADPKICSDDNPVDGAIPYSQLPNDYKNELLSAYNEAVAPKEVTDIMGDFQDVD